MNGKKYGVLAINRGRWGGMRSWCHTDGKVILFDTYEEAAAEAERYRESQGRVNCFTSYSPQEYSAH